MPVLTKINSNVIADDAITGDKLGGSAYLANTASQNISGTYSENRMYTSDAYTLSGNATVNSELILSTVKPNTDVVLTAGGAYTITGTGVLSGGTMFAQQKDLTGMTGEIESAVTGSPNLNLGNATMPAGMLVQSKVLLTHTSSSGSLGNATGNFESVAGGNFTTKLASTASMLRIWWETNEVHSQENTGNFNMTLRQSSSSTTYAANDTMFNQTKKVRMYVQDASNDRCSWSMPITWPFVSGTDQNSTAYVANISSWSAGETLYWRLFQQKESGPNNIFAFLEGGRMEIRLEEITI